MVNFLEKFSLLEFEEDLSAENIQWMWEVKELNPFLDWIVKYTDDSNCISNLQLQKYDDWCQAGNELRGSALDSALKECGTDVEEFLHSDFSLDDLELCEQEVDLWKIQYDSALQVEAFLNEELQKLLSCEQNMETKLKTAQMSCQKEGQTLMKINVPLKANISGLFANARKLAATLNDSDDPDVQNSCLSSMPLESTLNVAEKFSEYASLSLKRKFEQSSCNEKNSVSELMSYLEGNSSSESRSLKNISNSLPNKMWQTDVNRIEMLGALKGYTAATQHMQSVMSSPSLEKLTPLQMRMELVQLESENSRLSEDIDLIMKHEVSRLAEDYVVYSITRVVENITKSRIVRRQATLRELCTVANVTKKFLLATDVLWMLIKLESHRFKSATGLLQVISDFFTEELNRHKATMSGLNMVLNNEQVNEDALKAGQILLLNTVQKLQRDFSLENNSRSGSLGSLPENQLKELQYVPISNVLCLDHQKYLKHENSIYELLFELTNGPTTKPSLVKNDVVLSILEIQAQLKQYNTQFTDLATLFSSKQLLFKKSPVSRNRRLLWAWFLVAPDKLKEAVDLGESEQQKKK